jgi:hypothetical protein
MEQYTNKSTFIFTLLYNMKHQMSTLGKIQQGVQHMVSPPERDEQQSDLSNQVECGIGQENEIASNLMYIALWNNLLEQTDQNKREH